jgi:hypothetical protein
MPIFRQIIRQENRILYHTPWFLADVWTDTYHIALVQICLFVFYFSCYFTAQKINYVNSIDSINQINHVNWKIFADGCWSQVYGHDSCKTHYIEKSKKPTLPQVWTRESGIFESCQFEF